MVKILDRGARREYSEYSSDRPLVLDGCYLHLLSVGVPLPLCVHMQELGLMLGTAQWTAKQSSSGFSVSFFWPASHHPFCSNPRKRRRRRKKHNNRSNSRKKPKSPSCEKESAVHQSTGLTTDPATVDDLMPTQCPVLVMEKVTNPPIFLMMN